jgi:hypothetical protein
MWRCHRLVCANVYGLCWSGSLVARMECAAPFSPLVIQSRERLLPVTGLESAGFDRCAISSFANRAFGTVLVMTKNAGPRASTEPAGPTASVAGVRAGLAFGRKIGRGLLCTSTGTFTMFTTVTTVDSARGPETLGSFLNPAVVTVK